MNQPDHHPLYREAPRRSRRLLGEEPAYGPEVLHFQTRALKSLEAANQKDESPETQRIYLHAFRAGEAQGIHVEPETQKEARESPEAAEWLLAEKAEMESLHQTGTYTLVDPPPHANILGCRFTYRIKDGPPKLYKARLVVQGFKQQKGVDYYEVFAPTAKMASLRVILHLAAYHDWEIHQSDFTTAFLNRDLDETIYMRQVPRHEDPKHPRKVCLLQKALYGLKQAPRQWYLKLKQALEGTGFKQSEIELCLFMKLQGTTTLLVIVYVDDLTITGSSLEMIQDFKTSMASTFKMKDLGEMKTFLGLEITRDREARTISIGQGKYIDKILCRFPVDDLKPYTTPMEAHHSLTKEDPTEAPTTEPYAQLVGKLMYCSVSSRPDNSYALGVLATYMSKGKAKEKHWVAVRRVLKYLEGMRNWGITLGGIAELRLQGSTDASWGDDQSDRRSTMGYSFSLGSGPISWRSKRSGTVALSTAEAEYYAGTEALKECSWISELLSDIARPTPTPHLLCDNQSAIAMAGNPIFTARSKHIELKYHYIREQITRGRVTLAYVASRLNVADLFTKAFCLPRHLELCNMLRLPHVSTSDIQGEC